jgi:hypothetical protein
MERKMIKKLFTYIFIYTLIGCGKILAPDYQEEVNTQETGLYLEVSAPDLVKDDGGYYHMEWLEGYVQTFSTLDAETDSSLRRPPIKVMWHSDSGINFNGYWVSCVNPASYTNNGTAHTVLSAWEEHIGDTLTVYVYYKDEGNNEYFDSLKVVIDNEI